MSVSCTLFCLQQKFLPRFTASLWPRAPPYHWRDLQSPVTSRIALFQSSLRQAERLRSDFIPLHVALATRHPSISSSNSHVESFSDHPRHQTGPALRHRELPAAQLPVHAAAAEAERYGKQHSPPSRPTPSFSDYARTYVATTFSPITMYHSAPSSTSSQSAVEAFLRTRASKESTTASLPSGDESFHRSTSTETSFLPSNVRVEDFAIGGHRALLAWYHETPRPNRSTSFAAQWWYEGGIGAEAWIRQKSKTILTELITEIGFPLPWKKSARKYRDLLEHTWLPFLKMHIVWRKTWTSDIFAVNKIHRNSSLVRYHI